MQGYLLEATEGKTEGQGRKYVVMPGVGRTANQKEGSEFTGKTSRIKMERNEMRWNKMIQRARKKEEKIEVTKVVKTGGYRIAE